MSRLVADVAGPVFAWQRPTAGFSFLSCGCAPHGFTRLVDDLHNLTEGDRTNGTPDAPPLGNRKDLQSRTVLDFKTPVLQCCAIAPCGLRAGRSRKIPVKPASVKQEEMPRFSRKSQTFQSGKQHRKRRPNRYNRFWQMPHHRGTLLMGLVTRIGCPIDVSAYIPPRVRTPKWPKSRSYRPRKLPINRRLTGY